MADDLNSMRTPLGRVRFLGSARSGMREDWLMRVTSAALVPLTIAFVWLILSLLSKDYNGARAELGHPFPAILMMLFVLAGIYHMQIGMRSIIADYIHGRAREWALMANLVFAAALALACIYAVLRIGFV
ncbi:succinate dehydrogenase, hydrophobic membrane anchor protein [Methylocapsa sp. S129]|uniref:succinate dehydrogenase, hydrophobic membrane anchor protein n=1 Tax=Methylocapsa sp. S129 TaxID=1641869 RepID=UPI00131DCEF4|nr:succinate dehydrogenase, hydrophobic membrane anchor protein [Methylocapsa sp. S129]